MANEQQIILKPIGIVTNVSQELLPPGSFEKAENAVIDTPGIIKSRNGYENEDITAFYPDATAELPTDAKIKNLFTIGSAGNIGLMAEYNSSWSYANKDDLWARIDNLPAPADDTIGFRFLSLANYEYYTTNKGVYKIDTTTPANIYPLGVERALGVKTTPGLVSASYNFLPDQKVVSYRLVWGYYDYYNVLRLGSPSGRSKAVNLTGSSYAVLSQYNIPSEICADANRQYFYRLYRSKMVAYVDDTSEGSDELFLCATGQIDASDKAAKVISITDIQPEELLGETIYTANSQQGILQSNDIAPVSSDITTFKDMVFLGNIKNKQSLDITYIGGALIGDTFDIDSNTYTASFKENETNKQYRNFGIQVCPFSVTTLVATFTKASHGLAVGDVFAVTSSSTPASLANASYTVTSVTSTQFTVATAGVNGTGTAGVELSKSAFTYVLATNVVTATQVSHDFAIGDTVAVTQQTGTLLTGNYTVLTTPTNSTFTFASPAANSSGIAKVDIDVPTSITEIVAQTAQSMINIMNRQTATNLVAYYTSDLNTGPGKIKIEQVVFNTSVLNTSSSTNIFDPSMFGTNLTFSDNQLPNGIRFSKQGIHEAFPVGNTLYCGSSSSAITRIIGLRDCIFVFKDNAEIYRIIGETPTDLRVLLFDNTTRLYGPRSAVALNNNIYYFSESGVIQLNDTSGTPVSQQIKDQFTDFFNLAGVAKTTFEKELWAFGSDSDQRYYLCDGVNMWVYNFVNQSWTTFQFPGLEKYPLNATLVTDDVFTSNYIRASYTKDSKIVTIASKSHGLTTGDRIHVRNSSDTDILPNYAYIVISSVDADNFQIEIPKSPDTSTQTVVKVVRAKYTNPTAINWTTNDAPYMVFTATDPTYANRLLGNNGGLYTGGDYVTITSSIAGMPVLGTYLINTVVGNQFTFTDGIGGGPGFSDIINVTYEPRYSTTTNDISLEYFADNETAIIEAGLIHPSTNRFWISNGVALVQELNTNSDTDYKEYDFVLPAEVAPSYNPIAVNVKYNPIYGNANPGISKRFTEFTYFVKNNIEDVEFYFFNELSPTSIPMKVVGAGFGSAPVGAGFWGGGGFTTGSAGRMYLPLGVQRAVWLTVGVRTTTIEQGLNLAGLSIIFESTSPRISSDT